MFRSSGRTCGHSITCCKASILLVYSLFQMYIAGFPDHPGGSILDPGGSNMDPPDPSWTLVEPSWIHVEHLFDFLISRVQYGPCSLPSQICQNYRKLWLKIISWKSKCPLIVFLLRGAWIQWFMGDLSKANKSATAFIEVHEGPIWTLLAALAKLAKTTKNYNKSWFLQIQILNE